VSRSASTWYWTPNSLILSDVIKYLFRHFAISSKKWKILTKMFTGCRRLQKQQPQHYWKTLSFVFLRFFPKKNKSFFNCSKARAKNLKRINRTRKQSTRCHSKTNKKKTSQNFNRRIGLVVEQNYKKFHFTSKIIWVKKTFQSTLTEIHPSFCFPSKYVKNFSPKMVLLKRRRKILNT